MSTGPDRVRVRRAAMSVGLYVGVAAAVLVTVGVGVLIAAITLNSRHERVEHPGLLPGRDDAWVIDSSRVILLIVVFAVAGILLTGLVGWLAAGRAVTPLADALRLQRNFVADASHELRTPLTVLSSRVQVLERRLDRGQPVDDVVAALRRDAASMAEVLNDMLLSAEGAEPSTGAATGVGEAVQAAAATLEVLADEADARIQVRTAASAEVSVPRVTLIRCVVALLDNAIHHSPPGSCVVVTEGLDGDRATIRVSDAGPGIQGISPERIFERFSHAGDNGRHRSFGLGLALVRDVAVRYRGSVSVEETSEAGTTILLTFPVAGSAGSSGPASCRATCPKGGPS